MKTIRLIKWGAIALLFLFIGNIGQAQDSLGMHHVNTLDYWNGACDIQMVGSLAYVFSGHSGLRIMDLADPASPVEIGRGTWYDWEYPSGGVYVTGNRAYVATTCGCCAFDISDPTHPVQLACWWEDQSLCDIFVHDTVAVIQILQEYGSIPVVADISDLGNVLQIGDFGGEHLSPVGMVGDYLFMVDIGAAYWCMILVTLRSQCGWRKWTRRCHLVVQSLMEIMSILEPLGMEYALLTSQIHCNLWR